MSTIELIEQHAKTIRDGKHKTVRPGLPKRFPEAASYGEFGWQGDLKLTLVERVPENYVQVELPTDADRQLVPGNTQGSKHCLDSLDGVTLHRPNTWPNSGLQGPCLELSEERTIEHPTHGNVTIPSGMTILCGYQREFDAETRTERRNAD